MTRIYEQERPRTEIFPWGGWEGQCPEMIFF